MYSLIWKKVTKVEMVKRREKSLSAFADERLINYSPVFIHGWILQELEIISQTRLSLLYRNEIIRGIGRMAAPDLHTCLLMLAIDY